MSYPARPSVSCINCHFKKLCLPAGIDNHLVQRQSYQRGDVLFSQGDTMGHFHAVYAGAFKYVYQTTEGEEQIAHFFLPGDVAGLDAVYTRQSHAEAVAITQSSVCSVPITPLMQHIVDQPHMQMALLELMSDHLKQHVQLIQHYRHADQRVAAFLLKLLSIDQQRGNTGRAFKMPMSRKEMANYLQLTPETVSRTFTLLQDNTWLQVSGRHVEICDQAALETLTARSNA